MEMVLVIAILALVGTFGGYVSFSASKKEEFQAACQALEERLQFAEELMLLGTDLVVTFKREGRKFHVFMEPDRDFNLTTAKLLAIQAPLYGIEEVSFNNLPTEKIELRYTSKGLQIPQGELAVRGNYGEKILKFNKKYTLLSEDLYPNEALPKNKT